MSHIVLTPDQLRVVAAAKGPIEVRDDHGKVLARILSELDAQALAEYREWKANPGPTYPMSDVLARLKRLEKIAESENLTEARVHELLDKMRAGEPV